MTNEQWLLQQRCYMEAILAQIEGMKVANYIAKASNGCIIPKFLRSDFEAKATELDNLGTYIARGGM